MQINFANVIDLLETHANDLQNGEIREEEMRRESSFAGLDFSIHRPSSGLDPSVASTTQEEGRLQPIDRNRTISRML